MQLRPYQIKLSTEASDILKRKKLVFLAMQVRTGKSLTALQTCKNVNAKKVLFITKIKAFSSIQEDYTNFNFDFALTIINRESLHKIETNDFDVVVIDEVHGYATYPKPSIYQKEIKKRFGNIPMIFLSGTPTPESYSQFYHIFTLSNYGPFREYANFYKWAHDFVDIEIKNLGYAKVNDYSKARKDKFFGMIKHYILTYTQEEAGFESKVNEMVLYVDMKESTYKMIDKLKKDLFIKSEKTGKTITADTSVKLQQKMHQMFSGTIKLDHGSAVTIDDTKARYILEMFKDKKIAIFYNFVQELQMLKDVIGQNLTTSLEEFNTTDKWIALQIVSGREGISLAKADCLVMFNIQFSAVSYFQSIARLTTKDRKENDVFWIMANKGIESNIYKRVMNKTDYTNSHFKKDYGIKISDENKKGTRKEWV
jgi:hypothetical protein